MSHQPNLAVSRYTDLRHEPITRLLISIAAYQDTFQVSLEESIKLVSHLFNGIEGNVWVDEENSKNPVNGLSQDESASIQLFTMQFDSEPSLYEVLNKALCDENRQSLKPWGTFLKLFLTALHKIPSCPQTVWRGVRGENLSSKYPIGSRFAWWGVSSSTVAIETLENDIILGRTGLRSLFSIECKHGKPVAEHSYFKREREVILIPGSYFEVIGQLNPATDLYIIHLKEIDPPIPLVKLPFDITSLPAHVKEPSGIVRYTPSL